STWFVVIQGVLNHLIFLVANARRASFRPYRSTSFLRKVAQKSRTQTSQVAQRLNQHFDVAHGTSIGASFIANREPEQSGPHLPPSPTRFSPLIASDERTSRARRSGSARRPDIELH